MDTNQTTTPPTPPQQNTPASGASHNPSLDLAESFAPMPFSSGTPTQQPQPASAPDLAPESKPAPEPIPEPVILHEETVSPPKPPAEPPHAPISNVIMPKKDVPAPEFEHSITPQQDAPAPKPARTSMYENKVRGVGSPSPKDYGLVPGANRTSTPPPGSLAPQKPHRMSAQDAMYQSALGAPLEGPVIPSTGYQPASRGANELDPTILVTQPTPKEMLRDAETITKKPEEVFRKAAVRTFERDVATTITRKRLSISEMALAERERGTINVTRALPEEKKFSWWVLSGIGLAVLGVITITIAYVMQTRESEIEAPTITTQETGIPYVPITTLDVTDMGRAQVIRALSNVPKEQSTDSKISLIRLISYEEEYRDGKTTEIIKNLTTEDFFSQMLLRPPSRLTRALGKDVFFGTVFKNDRPVPFLVFNVVSYNSAFASMLEWERFLAEDLSFIAFATPESEITSSKNEPNSKASEGTATTSSSSKPHIAVSTTTAVSAETTFSTTSPTTTSDKQTQKPPSAPNTTSGFFPSLFLDVVIKNHDARLLKNPNGSSKIIYSFLTKDLLIIAQNEVVLLTVIDHLNTARFIR